MTEQIFPTDAQSQIELELLTLLVQEETPFPWNPRHPETEAYLNQLENQWHPETWELEPHRATTLINHLENLWPQVTLQKKLCDQFSQRIPSDSLKNLAQRVITIAQQAFSDQGAGKNLAEQLVTCVQEIVPQWNPEDLQVLARPLAYSFRDTPTDIITNTIANVPSLSWEQLSDLEQARLSLAIARYAWSEVTQNQT